LDSSSCATRTRKPEFHIVICRSLSYLNIAGINPRSRLNTILIKVHYRETSQQTLIGEENKSNFSYELKSICVHRFS